MCSSVNAGYDDVAQYKDEKEGAKNTQRMMVWLVMQKSSKEGNKKG